MTQARDLGDAANKANFLDNASSDLQTQITALILPAGLILPFGASSAPTGFLACDGSFVSKTTYAALWAVIGQTWGQATTDDFKLPDLRGAFLRGTGSHGTSNMANGNDFAGPSVGSFENDQIQNMKAFTDGSGFGGNLNGSSTDYGSYNVPWTSTAGGNWASDSFIENGQGNPRLGDETRPFNAGILYCISIGPNNSSGTSSGGTSSGGGGSSTPASTTSHANLMSTAGEMLIDSAGESLTTETMDDTVTQINTKLGGL